MKEITLELENPEGFKFGHPSGTWAPSPVWNKLVNDLKLGAPRIPVMVLKKMAGDTVDSTT